MNAPIIEISLRNLGDSLTGAFALHTEAVEKEVREAVKLAVERFDFKGVVSARAREAIDEALNQAIKRFFAHGEGAKLIDAGVHEALQKTLEPHS